MENKETQEESTEHEKKSAKKLRKFKLKMIIILVVIAVLGILAYLGRGLVVVATVNGSPISRLSLIKMLEKEAGKGLLDSLITEKLIHGDALAKNITVSDDDINAEIDKIKQQVTSQGGTFETALEEQGMTMEVLLKQIKLQKEIEALLADKVSVSDEEVAKYITDNSYPVTAGQEQVVNEQVKLQLKSKKLSEAAPDYIASLKDKAKINYFVNY